MHARYGSRVYGAYMGTEGVISMREEVKKHPLNSNGKYYVEQDTCLEHVNCVYVAPNNFRMDEKDYGAYVFKQPSTPEEEAQCRRAMEECPVAAIRDDGDI